MLWQGIQRQVTIWKEEKQWAITYATGQSVQAEIYISRFCLSCLAETGCKGNLAKAERGGSLGAHHYSRCSCTGNHEDQACSATDNYELLSLGAYFLVMIG